ncbi:MAG: hypothetical protein JW913_01840 [Chitinispirillaceae bacterium]|nr:hypothetical protein [Chitinispirillaceae bacterium]
MIPGFQCSATSLTAGVLLFAAGVLNVNSRTPSDNNFFIGTTASWHARDGAIDFGDNRIEHVKRNVLPMGGKVFGKNFGLPFGVRLELPIQLEAGKVTEETIDDVTLIDGTNPLLALNSKMLHIGFEPSLQFPFRVVPRLWAYGAIGGGIHYVSLIEEERIIDDRRIVEGDPWLEEGRRASFSAAAGAGLEITATRSLSFFLHYSFRFWQPVERMTRRDLFPIDAKSYAERFFTHSVSWGILFFVGH